MDTAAASQASEDPKTPEVPDMGSCYVCGLKEYDQIITDATNNATQASEKPHPTDLDSFSTLQSIMDGVPSLSLINQCNPLGLANLYNPRSLEMPPPSDNPLPSPEIRGMGTCYVCSDFFPAKQLRMCAKCQVAGPYCGRECQTKDWKQGGHKEMCGTDDGKAQTPHAEKGATKVLKLLYPLADKCFTFMDHKNNKMTDELSISSFSRWESNCQGPGILLMHFKDLEDLEYFCFDVNRCKDWKEVHLDIGNFSYIQWPPEGKQLPERFQDYSIIDKLRSLDVDELMNNLTLSQFAFGVSIGDTKSLHIAAFEHNTVGVPKPKLSATALSDQLCSGIENDNAYATCRDLMGKIKDRPGILWMGNLVAPKQRGFRRSDLKKVTPDLLKKALVKLRLDIALKRKDVNTPAYFFHEDGTGNNQCKIFLGDELWQTTLSTYKSDILRLDRFIGFYQYKPYEGSFGIVTKVFTFDIPFQH